MLIFLINLKPKMKSIALTDILESGWTFYSFDMADLLVFIVAIFKMRLCKCYADGGVKFFDLLYIIEIMRSLEPT